MTDEKDDAGLRAPLNDEMADSIDEEREPEMDDERLARLLDDLGDTGRRKASSDMATSGSFCACSTS
jgi:hypothetical protein